MLAIPSNLYFQWRATIPGPPRLQERAGALPLDERLLQQIWLHQRLRRERLATSDGQPVRVLHPGFWNHEPGPDFREAVLQIGTSVPASGDVEIDLHPQGWRQHAHDTNPAYRRVILHVVWNGGLARGPLPVLPLEHALDAPLEELRLWLHNDAGQFAAEIPAGQCSAPLRDLPETTRGEILRQAAQVRLQAKASQFQARARDAGWEQALWEGLFGALGYKHNVWPMRRLAELLPLIRPPGGKRPVLALQSRLLGLSGLLPAELPGARSRASEYLRSIWDLWWRERAGLGDLVLPRNLWHMAGLRPANHPLRRLALAAHWLASDDLPARLEQWFAASHRDAELLPSLAEVLQVEADEFWSWHWTLNSKPARDAQLLLGLPRVTDLAVNVILPWFWVRAAAGKTRALQQMAEHRYFAWPKAEDNARLRLARQRLLRSTSPRLLNTAAAQQGLLQILGDFCQHSNALCEGCPFPELVRGVKI